MPTDSSNFFHWRHPRVVATISTKNGWVLAREISPGTVDAPDLFEVRADLLLENSPALPGDIAELPLPVILTVRHPSEGGKGPQDPARRAEIYRSHWEKTLAIDLELSTAPEHADLIDEAKYRGITCIFSYHDFADTPTLTQLQSMTVHAAELGADLFKVATTTNLVPQLTTLLTWVENEKTLPLAAMGMGKLGKISRPLLAQLGSQLNYGYLDSPVVSGQWPASELRRVIDSLG